MRTQIRSARKEVLFGLDIEGEDISEEELARYIAEDMRLVMVEEVRILNKEIISETHKPT
jgi:hypothetical protein